MGIGNGLAEQLQQRVEDAGVLDSGGREEQFHGCLP
jgi:hypothetical protein